MMPFPAPLFASAPSGATDPNWSNVVLLLSGDGASGSTTFTDESPAAHGNATVSNVTVDTGVVKFGTGSIGFDSGSGVLQYANHLDWYLSADFTVEGWFNFTNLTASQMLFGRWTSGRSWQFQYSGAGTDDLLWAISTTGSDTIVVLTPGWTPTLSTWHHIVCERAGNDYAIGVDGTRLGLASNSSVVFDNGGVLEIGRNGGGEPFVGYMDELRITKGVARYGMASSPSYTAPTEAFPRS